jgi:uncharacterized protein YndB with AHSA1/START domain
MNANALPYSLDRTVVIAATPDIVFRFFTDSVRWASWWGAGSTVDARPGGKVFMRHPDGTESGGEVVELSSGKRFVFTYGFAKGKPFGVGESRVTITLVAEKAGTRLTLHHDLPDAAARDEHVQGWRFQLSLFANVVCNEVNSDADAVADAWFEAFADPDAARREATMRRIASETVRFQDRFSNLDGLADLLPHIAAGQRFMPGIRLQRAGSARHCQGMALCDWVMKGADGKEHGRGTNSFVFGPTGQVEWVTGFWTPMAQAQRDDT